MSHVTLSHTHGVNPGLMQCFFCMESSGVILYGHLPGDAEAPHMACIDFDPCSKCQEHMKQGIILVSIRDEDANKMFWHWHCPHCHNHKEVAVKEGAMPSAPYCNRWRCRDRPAMLSKCTRPTSNPYRTGGWVVVAEKFVKRVICPSELVDHMLKVRFAFMPDEVWDNLGLPQGKSDANTETSGTTDEYEGAGGVSE